MKKVLSLMLVLCLLVIAGCGGTSSTTPAPTTPGTPSTDVPRQKVYLECGGASNTSFVYSVMVALSEVVNSSSDFVGMNVQATGGSNAHYQMYVDGLVQMGTGSAYGDISAWRGGSETFPNPLQNARVLLVTATNYQCVIVRVDSGINSMSDLNGKQIAVGNAGAPTCEFAEGTLKSLGINYTPVYSTAGEAVDMLKDGIVDCLIYTAAPGNSIALDAMAGPPCKLISLTAEEAEKCVGPGGLLYELNGAAPMTSAEYEVIPAGEEVIAITDFGDFNVNKDMEDDVIIELLDCYWNNIEGLRTGLKGLTGTPELMADMKGYTLPVIAKYYKDKFGVEIPADRIVDR